MIIDQHIIGCVDCPGEGKSAAADEPGLAEFAGGQLPADAQCRRAGNSAAPPSALGYFRDRGLCAWALREYFFDVSGTRIAVVDTFRIKN